MLKRVCRFPEVSEKHTAFSTEVESTAGLFLSNFLFPFTDVTWIANIFRMINVRGTVHRNGVLTHPHQRYTAGKHDNTQGCTYSFINS
jgi:hypothetical protein